jgi:hypothetical protein
MSGLIPISNTNATPMVYLDNSRPLMMSYADETFEKLTNKHGNSPEELITIMTSISASIGSTKGFELDQLWDKIQKKLYNDRTLTTKGKTDANKAQIAAGFFYTALNQIDMQSKDTQAYATLKSLYTGVKDHIENKFLSTFESKDQRVMLRIFDTIDNRFTKIAERMNTSIENGEMSGPKISV